MTGLEELDEADIEDAIRRELEALDDLDVNILEGFSDAKYEGTQTETFKRELSGEEKYGVPPDSVKTFIRLLQSRNDKLQEELAEAEDAVRLASKHKNATDVVENESEEDELKISPEVKEKVLHEIEDLDQNDIISENKDGNVEDISSQEEIALRNLKELEMKQDQRSSQLNSLFSEIKEDEILRHEREEKMRTENKRKANEEHKMKMSENESVKLKLEEEAKHQQQKLQDLQKKFELDMKNLEKIRMEEKLALERMKSDERKKREVRKELASITIQKNFRMYRVQSKYGSTLEIKREERQKRRQEELEALKQKEKRMMEEALQKEKEDEARRLEEIKMEKMRKEEEERKRKEDERKREEQRKKLEREKKQEEERKKELERKLQEEERLKREEQERKMAEERKRREEEEQRRIEEQKRLEEQKLEQKKLEEQKELERKRLEEQKLEQKKLEEQRELERKRLEEEHKLEQKKLEEQKRLEEQKQLERKRFEEEQRLQQKKLEEQKRLEEKKVEELGDAYSNFSQESSSSMRNCSDLYLVWESCREKWLKRTILWSAFSVVEKTNVKSRSKPRRPLSASQKLSSISEVELLKSQKANTSLDNMVLVNVKDLPPRNLKILSKCPNVKTVTVQNCSVLSTESFDSCHHLLQLNLSDNSIQNVSCQNLESLEYLDLRNNQLTSIHGLDGCRNLRWLYLDGNKITRIGALPCNKVIHLSLQSNQLITTKGLSSWKYLQILDCSNNHLSQIHELDSCPLLRILKLRGNNLRKPPELCNHVLLREIDLGENSITSLEGLTDQWLPLLQHLYVNNNSLSSVCSLRNFPMLETLDVKNNLISDEENLLPGLTECDRLRKLAIQANPVCEDSSVRVGIVKRLPKLEVLDGEKLERALNKDDSDVETIFHSICGAQILAQDDLLRRQNAEIENCQAKSDDDSQVVKRLTLQSRHFQELQDLMIQHRLQHETIKKADTNQRSQRDGASTSPGRLKQQQLRQENLKKTNTNEIISHSETTCSRPSVSSTLSPSDKENEQTDTARSVGGAKDSSGSTINNASSPGVSMANLTKTNGNSVWKQKDHEAATRIQARFRGYRMRRRYLEATKTAQYSDIDLETDDFNFDEEVDVDMFDIDEAALDTDWVPTNIPQTPRLDNFPPKQQQGMNETLGFSSLPPGSNEEDRKLPFPRKHAWRSPDSPISSPNPRKVIPPIEAPSVLSEQTSPPEETHRSHRTSELSSEWGFSNNSTAELMMKRANRMKYNALRKKKMTDPEKRFQLFKKADESNKARGVQTVHKRKEKPRVDYFSGRHHGDHEIQEEESHAKKEMTFSWVYDQAVLHKDQREEIVKDTREYYNESKPNKNRHDRSPPGVSLPRMDPVILAGRNLPLVASPVSNPRTPSIYSGDVEIGSRRKYSWQQTKTHSNPDLTRVGLAKDTRSGKSSSAEARIIKERNNIL